VVQDHLCLTEIVVCLGIFVKFGAFMKHKLKFGLNPDFWRLYTIRSRDTRFTEFKNQIFIRDSYTCRYCDFNSKEHMCVINLDYNYRNNNGNNLATACPLCAQCHFICVAGDSKEFCGGTIIYAPELSQVEINSLCHVVFCSVVNDTEYSNLSQNIYNNLRLRSNSVEKNLGKGMSNPKFFAQMLIDTPLSNKSYKTRNILENIRLLPSRSGFSKQIIDWSKSSLEDFK